MPSETGIAVTAGETKRGRGRSRKFDSAALARLSPEADDLFHLWQSGNTRLSDDELERLCGITPAMVYAMREIAEGRVTPGAMATIEAFCKFAEIGHRPAKGRAKAESGGSQQVVIVVQPPPRDVTPVQIEPPKDVIDVID